MSAAGRRSRPSCSCTARSLTLRASQPSRGDCRPRDIPCSCRPTHSAGSTTTAPTSPACWPRSRRPIVLVGRHLRRRTDRERHRQRRQSSRRCRCFPARCRGRQSARPTPTPTTSFSCPTPMPLLVRIRCLAGAPDPRSTTEDGLLPADLRRRPLTGAGRRPERRPAPHRRRAHLANPLAHATWHTTSFLAPRARAGSRCRNRRRTRHGKPCTLPHRTNHRLTPRHGRRTRRPSCGSSKRQRGRRGWRIPGIISTGSASTAS